MTKYTRLHIENRINLLSRNPVENAKLIRKWERLLRRASE